MSLVVGVIGSRAYPRLDLVRHFVCDELPPGAVVVSGGARGVDSVAEDAARSIGLGVVSIRADWSRGRGAGVARNGRIVARSQVVIAFWDGASRGTLDTIRKARIAGKLAWVVGPDGSVTYGCGVAVLVGL